VTEATTEIHWYIQRGTEKIGPLTRSEIVQRAKDKQLKSSDFIWHDGLGEWQPAAKLSELMRGNAQSTETSGEERTSPKEGKARSKDKDVVQSINRLDNRVHGASKALFDAMGVAGKDDVPALFLKENYFGGRIKRGLPIEILKGKAAKYLTILFSWLYLLVVFLLLGSAWQFLPLRKTEFLSIRLRRRVQPTAVFPFAVTYLVQLMVGQILIGLILFISSIGASVVSAIIKDSTPFFFLAALSALLWVISVGWFFYCNYTLWRLFRDAEEDGLLEYQAILEYGYPKKVRLIGGISTAGLEEQLTGVMSLCETLSKTDFSPWEQLTVHGDASQRGLIGRTWMKVSSIFMG